METPFQTAPAARDIALTDAERQVFELYRSRSRARADRMAELQAEESRDQREAADVIRDLAAARLGAALTDDLDLAFRPLGRPWGSPQLVVVPKERQDRARLDGEAQSHQ